MSSTVHARLDEMGTGTSQMMLLLGIGFATFSESLEMGAVAPLHTALARTFGFSKLHRSELPLITFAGAGVGLAVSGPIADAFGRKFSLALSLVLIAISMICTSLLQEGASVNFVLALRFFSGFASAIQLPSGLALAAESCPRLTRSSLIFRIMFLSSLGYLLEAVGILYLMPGFGEEDTDRWRGFCLLTAAASLATLPLVLMLYESPCFLAVQGRGIECVNVLDGIAYYNGKEPLANTAALMSPRQYVDGESPAQAPGQAALRQRSLSHYPSAMGAAVTTSWLLVVILASIDSCRTFFVSGSSYLWKDLLALLDGSEMWTPANLNVIGSFAPLLGLIIGERVIHLGVRSVAFRASLIAGTSMIVLAHRNLRSSTFPMVLAMMCAKLTYGTLGTCVSLMKVESFPTEIRVSAFGVISVCAKVLCAVAPTMVEMLKGNETAESWKNSRLELYIWLLALSVLLSGVLSLLVPSPGVDKNELQDFVDPNQPQFIGDDVHIRTVGDYGTATSSTIIGTKTS
jgi:MFS family permease